MDEAQLRDTFGKSGTITSCNIGAHQASGLQQAVIIFTTYAAALDAKAAGPPAGVCTGLSPFYNELAYDARGWCCFEDMVSMELIMRLQHYGSVGKALGSLPPKMLALSSANPAGEDATLAGLAADTVGHVARAEERIRAATFTNGSSDKERVVKLYRDYVERVEAVLTKSVEFIQEVQGVPVLLSMLAVVLGSQDTESGHLRLPRDLYELYKMAVGAVIGGAIFYLLAKKRTA